MNRCLLGWFGAVVLLCGCATGLDEETGNDGSGGTGAQLVGGGHAAGGGGSGGDETYPCGMDCSTISTDECLQPICNTDTGKCAVVNAPLGTPCDDERFCTVGEYCNEGICGGGTDNDCDLEVPACSAAQCNESSQSCSVVAAFDGATCVSDDLCTVNATCSGGQCVGTEKDCLFAPIPNECYVSVCNPLNGNCEPIPSNEGQPCNDSTDLCTVDKVCGSAGDCIGGQPMDCSTLTVGCYDGVCDDTLGQCVQQAIAPGSTCAAATDDCNQGICDTAGSCNPNPVNEGGACEDGLACTTGSTCTAGVCGGGTSTINIYFSEDFSSNSAGWTLGTEWQIGAAAASSGQSYGNPDPAQDHSNTADNGVAGVVIGGNASTASLHDYYYLTSPPVDVSAATTVYLEFFRWLNSDYTPYMQNVVEVFDGTSWVTVWSTGSTGTLDTAWTPVNYDLTAYKNTQLRVRFGFSIGSSGVFTVSSWNIDDVVLADGICNP